MVEIDEDQRELVVIALRAINFGFENESHVAGVVKRSAVVGDGEFVDALDVTRIFERNRGKVRKCLEQLEIPGVETARANAVDQLNDAKARISKFYRDGNDGSRLHLGLL